MRTSYKEAIKENPSLESSVITPLDIIIKSEEWNLTRVRKQAYRSLIENGIRVGADYVFIDNVSYIPLPLPYSQIWFFISAEARQKLKNRKRRKK